ncbi:MAG: HEPN domain-containing protein [Thermodesulfobacteriota bacterium]
MTSRDLAKSLIKKAEDRLDILDLPLTKRTYSDVVREAQEIVELPSKGMLRAAGIEPPKFHDVAAFSWSIKKITVMTFPGRWRGLLLYPKG